MCLSANVNVSGNVPVRFQPSVAVFPLDLEALSEQFHLCNLNLPCFSVKKIKKNLRAKIKLTVLFKNRAPNLETQKHTKRIEIHQSQITNDDLLFPKRFTKMYKTRESEESATSSDFD